MLLNDFLQLTFSALIAHKLRSFLTMLGIAVGIAAVILLTSIGAGIHGFVISEFTQFGTNLINITPGRATTFGGSVGVIGSVKPLTINDSLALARVPLIKLTDPAVQGNAEVQFNRKSRRTTVYGVGPNFPETLRLEVAVGQFLPHDDLTSPRAFAVLGAKVKKELFGDTNPLGSRIRVGSDRYRVIGVMKPKGEVLGFDMDDTVYIPAQRSLQLFNREGLMEIHVVYDPEASLDKVVEGIRTTLIAKHGREDFTITPQQKMLDVLSSILNILTFAVGALGGVSLLVGGVGILTIMTISVSERTSEIGLLRALGAKHRQILAIFLGEATILAALGGLVGLTLGVGIAQLLHIFVMALPIQTPWSFAVIAEAIAIAIGLIAGVAPARRAARLDPIIALQAE